MWLVILKWICFVFVFLDFVSYILEQPSKIAKAGEKSSSNAFAALLGFCIGIAMRVFVLYGTITCWLLA